VDGGEDMAASQAEVLEGRGGGRRTGGAAADGGEDMAASQAEVLQGRGGGIRTGGAAVDSGEDAAASQADALEPRVGGWRTDGATVDGGEDATVSRAEVLARRGGGRSLNEAESLALFAEHGVPVVRHAVAHSPEEAASVAASFGLERVVVKMLSRTITHKSDVGGVKLGVPLAEVAAACREMRSGHAGQDLEGWLIEEHLVGGTEMLLGLTRDAQLGPAMMLGAGGVATEVFGDSTLRLLPLRKDDPREMLSELRCRVLLEGFRGQPPGDVDALFEAMRRFAALGEQVQEAEINPLFVLPRGQGVVAADGLVILTEG
jgi:hypothetical protein